MCHSMIIWVQCHNQKHPQTLHWRGRETAEDKIPHFTLIEYLSKDIHLNLDQFQTQCAERDKMTSMRVRRNSAICLVLAKFQTFLEEGQFLTRSDQFRTYQRGGYYLVNNQIAKWDNYDNILLDSIITNRILGWEISFPVSVVSTLELLWLRFFWSRFRSWSHTPKEPLMSRFHYGIGTSSGAGTNAGIGSFSSAGTKV